MQWYINCRNRVCIRNKNTVVAEVGLEVVVIVLVLVLVALIVVVVGGGKGE